jgi:hypothetical protein
MGCAAAAVVAVSAVADAIATISIADVAVGAAIGAGIGGVTDAIEHKPILGGIIEGGLAGGLGGAAGAVGGALGGTAGAIGGDILGGAAGGALGGAVTGQGAGVGAESGAIGGAVSGLAGAALSPSGGAAAGSPTAGGPGASAAGLAAPASIGADTGGLPLGVSQDTGAPIFSPSNVAAATTGPGFGAAPDTGSPVFSSAVQGATAGINPDTGVPIFAPEATVPSPINAFAQQDATAGATAFAPIAATDQTFGGGVLDGGGDATGGTTDLGGPIPANVAAQNAGLYPVPPVPPADGVSGVYPTLGAAQAASESNAIETAGGIIPQQTGLGAVNQALNPNVPAAGTLGYQIDPSLGTNPYVPSGAGPGGTYTLAQGASTGAASAAPGFIDSVKAGNIGGAVNAIGTGISNNPAIALGGALIGYDVLRGNQVPKGENAINATATQLGQQATQLESYLSSGTLPPGVSTALKQAASSAEAAIRSQYAARGESGSSAEQADLANVQNTIVSQGASIATNLLSSGIQENQLAAQLYGQIMNQSLASDAQLTQALGVLAAASARPTTVTLAGTASG